MGAGGSPYGAICRAVLARERTARFNRELVAPHEAAHALVAGVLGLPVESAWVNDGPDWRNVAGAVRMNAPSAAQTLEASHCLLARSIAVSLAGIVGERGARPKEEIMRDLYVEEDWIQAKELSWFAASLRLGQVLFETVLDALIPALHAAPWIDVVREGATVLLQGGSNPVPADVFAAIARRFYLALPEPAAIGELAIKPSRPVQE